MCKLKWVGIKLCTIKQIKSGRRIKFSLSTWRYSLNLNTFVNKWEKKLIIKMGQIEQMSSKGAIWRKVNTNLLKEISLLNTDEFQRLTLEEPDEKVEKNSKII